MSKRGGLLYLDAFLFLLCVPSSLSISCYTCSNFKLDKSVTSAHEDQLRHYLAVSQTYSSIKIPLETECSSQTVTQCAPFLKECISSHVSLSTEADGLSSPLGVLNIHMCGSKWLEQDNKFCELTEEGLSAADVTSLCYMESCDAADQCNIPTTEVESDSTEDPDQETADNLGKDDAHSESDETDIQNLNKTSNNADFINTTNTELLEDKESNTVAVKLEEDKDSEDNGFSNDDRDVKEINSDNTVKDDESKGHTDTEQVESNDSVNKTGDVSDNDSNDKVAAADTKENGNTTSTETGNNTTSTVTGNNTTKVVEEVHDISSGNETQAEEVHDISSGNATQAEEEEDNVVNKYGTGQYFTLTSSPSFLFLTRSPPRKNTSNSGVHSVISYKLSVGSVALLTLVIAWE